MLSTLFVTVWMNDRAWYITIEPAAAAESDAMSQTPEFKQAGVCARCHVVSVLEWGFSSHFESETDCKSCHGPSLAHVADERNEANPDHFHRGSAIAEKTCLRCHESGCEETDEQKSCEKCHHVHALVNPSKPPQLKDDRLVALVARWQRFDKKMAEGDRHVERSQWKEAEQAFQAALELTPGDHRARMRLEMCSRRLRPELRGFVIADEEFHAATGLPREVAVAGLETPMLLVPPGEFDMGSDDLADSRPVHTVHVDALYLGRYEVTQAEWNSVMSDNPSAHQGESYAEVGRMPVERVSWNDCQEFLQRLNKRVPGGGFRLPTEAEWEYACRAGSDRLSGKELPEHAWFGANSLRASEPSRPFLQVDAYAPRPAGTRKPNAWGFSDMQGNVGEWCSSLSQPYLYRADDGRESRSAAGLRIVRGGSYADSRRSLDPALRHAERPHRRLRFNGLRLARDVPSVNVKTLVQRSTTGSQAPAWERMMNATRIPSQFLTAGERQWATERQRACACSSRCWRAWRRMPVARSD